MLPPHGARVTEATPVATGGHLRLSDLSACVGVSVVSFGIIVFSC